MVKRALTEAQGRDTHSSIKADYFEHKQDTSCIIACLQRQLKSITLAQIVREVGRGAEISSYKADETLVDVKGYGARYIMVPSKKKKKEPF